MGAGPQPAPACADSDPGRLVARNNSLTNSGPCEVNGTVAALPYGYTAENVGTVKAETPDGPFSLGVTRPTLNRSYNVKGVLQFGATVLWNISV